MKQNEISRFKRLRRRIMEELYTMFKTYPYASIEFNHLTEKFMVPADELNWNMAYLEKAGYVELTKSYDAMPYIASSATITREGIDLVEDDVQLERIFPDADPPVDTQL